MQIGGFVKQTFIDYPNKMAAVVFTAGCNFRCRYCHNPQLVLPALIQKETLINPAEILHLLNNRKNWLDGVVITGGEPTLHNDLPDFIAKIKNMKYDVKLDTNGTNPQMLKSLIDKKLIDFVAMDIKAPLRLEAYQTVVGQFFSQSIFNKVLQSVEIIKQSGIEYEFRTTLDRSIDKEAQQEIQEQLQTPVTWQTVRHENRILEDMA